MALLFVSLVLIQFFNAYNFRSEQHSIVRRPFANRWLNLAILWEVVLLGVVVYVPALQPAFGTVGVTLFEWDRGPCRGVLGRARHRDGQVVRPPAAGLEPLVR